LRVIAYKTVSLLRHISGIKYKEKGTFIRESALFLQSYYFGRQGSVLLMSKYTRFEVERYIFWMQNKLVLSQKSLVCSL